MTRVTVAAALVLMSISAAHRISMAAESIDQARAWVLAVTYAARYLPDWDAALPTLHTDHWESKVTIITKHHREPAGMIRVDRVTGEVSYEGRNSPKPHASADALDRWYGAGHD